MLWSPAVGTHIRSSWLMRWYRAREQPSPSSGSERVAQGCTLHPVSMWVVEIMEVLCRTLKELNCANHIWNVRSCPGMCPEENAVSFERNVLHEQYTAEWVDRVGCKSTVPRPRGWSINPGPSVSNSRNFYCTTYNKGALSCHLRPQSYRLFTETRCYHVSDISERATLSVVCL